MSRWDQKKKIIATVLSGLWFLVIFLSPDSSKKTGDDAKSPTAATATATPQSSAPAAAAPPPAPAAVMPSVVGTPFAGAEKAVEALLDTELTALSAYEDVTLPADHTKSVVCFQEPAAGAPLASKSVPASVHLVAAGTKCPAEKGTNLRPKSTPKPTPTPTPKPTVDEDDSGSGGGGSVSYRNCSAVKAAGKAPIRRGDPGYGQHLDRDGDGIACER
ncbi:excalibur calcium-binding domain-containing protein [Streptomyces sp. NBC_01351]|uniref:excalibur calcium-binding domain-containing protein n=1 Tax=Streptomyces sp. NBC_01351 TaxID=2903833 RepID=UPI002E378955|nr:excalibur calcium-binding domain-containing protein [Streptomyces sp. NBC_01351]